MKLKKKIFMFYATDDFKNLKPNRGAQKVIDVLSTQHELHVITSRSDELKSLTFEWLDAYFPNKFKSVYYNSQYSLRQVSTITKLDVCKSIHSDYIIDDNLNTPASVREAV